MSDRPALPDAISRYLNEAARGLRLEANPPAWQRDEREQSLVLAYFAVRDGVLAGRLVADDLDPRAIAGCWIYLAGSAARALRVFDGLREASVDPVARWPRIRALITGAVFG